MNEQPNKSSLLKNEIKKPNPKTAWNITTGAIFAQVSYVFSVGAIRVEGGFLLAVLSAASAVGLSLFAVGEWKKYLEAFMQHAIQSHSKD